MDNNHTDFEISKLIHAAVPELLELRPGNSYYIDDERTYVHGRLFLLSEDEDLPVYSYIVAYRLDDLMRAIKALGEKRGTTDSHSPVDCQHHVCLMYRLVEAYITDDLQFGTRCKEFLTEIFKQEV